MLTRHLLVQARSTLRMFCQCLVLVHLILLRKCSLAGVTHNVSSDLRRIMHSNHDAVCSRIRQHAQPQRQGIPLLADLSV